MNRSVHAGLLLVMAATLVNELTLLRVFSVTMWYHFAFLTICIAMLGMSAAATLVYAAPRTFRKESLGAQLPWFSIAYGATLLVAIFGFLGFPVEQHWESPPPLAQAFVLFLIPFVCSGFIPTLLFAHHPERIGGLYFADLVGAALGCIGTVGLLYLVTGPEAIVVACAPIFLSAWFFARAYGRRRVGILGLVLAVVCALFPFANGDGRFLKIVRGKSYKESEVLFELWNPLSRVTVFDRIFWRDDSTGFKWGGDDGSGGFKPEEKWIEQDGNAGTPLTRFDGDLAKYTYLEDDATFVAYALGPFDNAFIIGPGGGRDILGALYFGTPRVVAAELNPSIYKVADELLGDFTGHIYSRPGVEARIGEGRSTLRAANEKFDLIQISLIDSWAATLAGAFVLVENNLYTLEAFRLYLDRLTDDGVLTVSRWHNPEFVRAVVLGLYALRDLGVEDPMRHFAVVGRGDLMTLLVRKRALTEEDVATLERECAEHGFVAHWLPGRPTEHDDLKALAAAPSVEDFVRNHPMDVAPPTDDRPFFFQVQKSMFTRDWSAPPAQGFLMLRRLVVWVSGFVVALVFVPLVVAIGRRHTLAEAARIVVGGRGAVVFFLCLGVGYLTIEIALVQHFILFLGHPIYATSVVLFSMLLASGIGSLATDRFVGAGAVSRGLGAALVAVVALLVAILLFLNPLFLALQGLPLSARVALSVAILGALGFAMGMPFPCGLKLLTAARREELIPWMWSLNGAASVLASVAAIALAIRLGYSYCLALGIGCYAVAWLANRFSLGPDATAAGDATAGRDAAAGPEAEAQPAP